MTTSRPWGKKGKDAFSQRRRKSVSPLFAVLFAVRGEKASALGSRRGSALLTVLWISAALSAIAFSLATTVRGETERVSTDLDGLRAYYLAAGAVERASIEKMWANWYPDKAKIPKGSGWIMYTFPTGVARVELIPETAKFDVNAMQPDRLMRMLAYMGVDQGRAQAITEGIISHRRGGGAGAFSTGPSFPGAPTSFQEIEELLSVPGVTPEILYGTYVPDPEPVRDGSARLVRRSGLADCLSVFGSRGPIDANGADPAALAALGIPPSGIQMLVEARTKTSLDMGKLSGLNPYLGPGAGHLRTDGNSMWTIRATATVRLANGQLSEVRRSVAARVKFMPKGWDTWLDTLRWYDTVWSN